MYEQYSCCRNIAHISMILWGYVLIWYSRRDGCTFVQTQYQAAYRGGVESGRAGLTAAESKATYDDIKSYVLEKHGLKVSSLYISQVKRKCGLDVGQNYNLSKKENAKVPQCPPEKEAAIMEALKHFQMI